MYVYLQTQNVFLTVSKDQKSLKAIGVDLEDMRSIFQPSLKQFKCKRRLSSHLSGVLGNNNDDSHNSNNRTNIY